MSSTHPSTIATSLSPLEQCAYEPPSPFTAPFATALSSYIAPNYIKSKDIASKDITPESPLAVGAAFADKDWWLREDAFWMQQALAYAQRGAQLGEVPVGAVLVNAGKLIGAGFNQPIMHHDPTCHAEIVALRQACQRLNNYRLPLGSTLYVTLEPCTMCFGALIHARLSRLVFATVEPRAGMLGSQLNLAAYPFYNHKLTVHQGLGAEQSSRMLKSFFKQRRRRCNAEAAGSK